MPYLIVVSYAAILGLSVAISGYLSYEGLLRSAHEITLPLVVFLMTIIFSMDATISYFRSTERSYRLPIFIWAVAAFFSIASNFNFLYSNFMKDDVIQSTLAEQITVFRSDIGATRQVLASTETVRFAVEQRTDLKVEFDNLSEQINDPLRPGCGEECRGHMAEIERILGRSVTNLAVPSIGSDSETVSDWYDRYRATAEETLENLLGKTSAPAIFALTRRIDNALLEYDSVARLLANKDGLSALPEMSSLSQDIEREANELLPQGVSVKHETIDPTLGRLGEIVYAFQNGFGEMPNPLATAMSLVIASVIDLLPFLLSFALFGKGRLERSGHKRRERVDRGTIVE
ncbi:MAG: hypothetical protein F4213_21675 [Boseongicola sp. SB0677_bin_26]|nr:hypothetical protein [Boseongicola sp. SB0665_bin_10]MYG28591.1 hypothetical protein [Boseongicola sp. SB0677_bin_26]